MQHFIEGSHYQQHRFVTFLLHRILVHVARNCRSPLNATELEFHIYSDYSIVLGVLLDLEKNIIYYSDVPRQKEIQVISIIADNN